MNTERIAATLLAALVSLLLILSPATAEEFNDARLVGIEDLGAGSYPTRLSIRIGNRVERLLMTRSTSFNDLPIVDNTGKKLPQSSVAYAGIVESLPDSWARVVIDGDYIAGTIHTNNISTHFTSEPALNHRATDRPPSWVKPLLAPITPPPEVARPATLNGIPVKRNALNTNPTDLNAEVSVPVSDTLVDTNGNVTRVIRIGIVVDSLYQEAIGGRGLSKAIATINSVDGLYRENFGLALKVDAVVLVTDDTSLRLDGSTLESNLGLFRDYRIQTELLPDTLGLVHLFTGIDSGDDAVGLAYKGAACRTDGYDVSMSRPFTYPVLLTTHEIGHNLGADHDDATQACHSISDNLMFSTINSSTTREFSSCSSDTINTRMQQSTCFEAAIDIDLQLTQLESNQVQASVTNLDDARAFPSATLFFDLKNAAIAEAPAMCVLEDPTKLTCAIPATFAGDTQDLAVKFRLTPELERTITVRLEPDGFFDLNQTNNAAELIIPGEPQPLAVTSGEITTQGAGASGGNSNNGSLSTGNSNDNGIGDNGAGVDGNGDGGTGNPTITNNSGGSAGGGSLDLLALLSILLFYSALKINARRAVSAH